MSNILKRADDIVNHRSEEKERQYGHFYSCMTRAASIFNLINPYSTQLTTQEMYKAMIAMKLAREGFKHKEDNLLDAVAYMGSLNDYIEDLEKRMQNEKGNNV
jgi:hypothetical protein